MQPILFFDSGIGGLTVMREVRLKMPERQFIYVADDACFPYGDWQENELKAHILDLFSQLIARYKPALCVIACNTASTLVLKDLREKFPNQIFVGTVPAIKPAAERTRSQLITVLATPGTVKRAYTTDLITSFAGQCDVHLVGSHNLASYAEDYLRGVPIDMEKVRHEILPCFIEKDGKYTDIIVLACTHYPFLTNVFRKLAPWPVDWLDPAEAIANHVQTLIIHERANNHPPYEIEPHHDIAYFTSGVIDFTTKRLLYGFGLKIDGNA